MAWIALCKAPASHCCFAFIGSVFTFISTCLKCVIFTLSSIFCIGLALHVHLSKPRLANRCYQAKKKCFFCLALARQTFPSRLCIPVQRESRSITLSQTCMLTTFSFLNSFLRNSNKRGEHRDSYKVVSLAWDALKLNLPKQAPLWVLLKMVTHWLRSTKPCFMHWFIKQMLEQQ